MLAVSRRVVSSSVKRQAQAAQVRSFSKKYPHKPREEAFVPGLVSRYNVEDQVCGALLCSPLFSSAVHVMCGVWCVLCVVWCGGHSALHCLRD